MTKKINELKNGFTLIEIIASITILGILIMFLLPAFPKIMTGSSHTEDKMVTGNLLTRVVADAQKNEELKQYISNPQFSSSSDFNCNDSTGMKDVPDDKLLNIINPYEIDGKEFKVKISICQTDKEKEIGIVRTKIKITSPDEKESSETFTYIDK